MRTANSMEDTICFGLNIEDHWLFKLKEYKNHPLQRVIEDFVPDIKRFIFSSYLYLGELSNNRVNRQKIAIIHYHSSLNGPLKFMDIQNINSYEKISGINEGDVLNLGLEITRDSVIQLSYPNALEYHQLDFLNQCKTFIICNERGEITEYE